MTKSCSRKIVVLRDIPSNMIEEAILFLKTDDAQEYKNINGKRMNEKKRDFLLIKEAEMIIDGFISDRNSINKKKTTVFDDKKWYIDLMINAGLFIGIGIFVYLLFKLL